MNFKEFSTSTQKYVILLVFSVVVLLFAEALTFRQFNLFEDSSEEVAHTQDVQMAINALFSHYSQMHTQSVSTFVLPEATSDSIQKANEDLAFTAYNKLQSLIVGNPEQVKRLGEISALQKSFYTALDSLDAHVIDSSWIDNESRSRLQEVSNSLEAIRRMKNQMLDAEHQDMLQRKDLLNSRSARAPLFILVLALFSLCVILMAFARIYRNKQRIRKSEAFLQSILRNTTNIINYYEPVYDERGEVVDFTIVFANERNKSLGLEPDKIVGKRMSVIYPHLHLNGELNALINGYKNQEVVVFDRQFTIEGKKYWFNSTIVPHEDGILATGTNTTKEREDDEKLRQLNEELRQLNEELSNRNEELINTEAFLEGVLRSTKNIIMTFEPVWAKDGEIGDFRLLFINQVVPGIIDSDETELVGKNISEISPLIFKSPIFRQMVHCYNEEKPVDLDTSFYQGAYEQWVQGTIIKWHKHLTINLTDITKLVRAEQNLRNRNRQLNRSNEELESFNRVASHDLQEPLRKIQMFLSRFFERDEESLSESGRDYLTKVQKAANRMQSLIVNLLAYSKIDDTQENFEPVDLVVILKKVKEDLALTINETGAKIKTDPLPTISGVPFQMEQLFLNLIANAIKYRKPGVEPKIVIRVEEVHQRQIQEEFFKASRNYYKITLIDNGIGFEAKNAAKIFEVFQRLHQKNEYSGTGIGLAICKKIVENHMGHIYASATPGEGATFIIYLPR